MGSTRASSLTKVYGNRSVSLASSEAKVTGGENMMEEQRYSANLPSVWLATFFRSPVCEDFSKVDADVAFLGIPYDCGIGFW